MKTFYPCVGTFTKTFKCLFLFITFSFLICFSSSVSAQVLVKQIYAGGGTLGATLNASYVQIINKSGSAVNLDGWTLQYETGKAKLVDKS